MVIRTGKLFEAGDYPDKGLSVTEDELKAAASTFTAVPNRIEHMSTILDGKVGKLLSVEANGKELTGKVAIPKWLHDAMGTEPIKASLEWLKSSKQIVGNALVLNPRIKDAQLVAAFSAANTNEGGSEVNGTQTQKEPGWFAKLKAAFSLKQLPEGMEDFDPDKVKFDGEPSPAPVTAPQTAPDVAQFRQELDTSKAENAALRAKLLRDEAVKFADGAIISCKALPTEKDSLIALFTRAAQDDSTGGVACFSASGEFAPGERVKLLQESVDKRTAHKLTNEELVVMSAGSTTNQTDPERMKKLREQAGLPAEGGK
jgi:hypothetical protein